MERQSRAAWDLASTDLSHQQKDQGLKLKMQPETQIPPAGTNQTVTYSTEDWHCWAGQEKQEARGGVQGDGRRVARERRTNEEKSKEE